MVLCQWSLVPCSSKGTAMRVVAMVTKLRTALMQKANHQISTLLPTFVAKQVLVKGSRNWFSQFVGCSWLVVVCYCCMKFVAGMLNGKFSFPPSRMASNFSLPGISRMGVPGKFPRFGNFPSFENFPSCGNYGNSRPMKNFRFLSAHISDSQSVFCIRKIVIWSLKICI